MTPCPAAGRAPIVVTGLAGAGRTTALKALEDMGFEAVDNLPLALLGPLLAADGLAGRAVAAGIDSRSRAFEPRALLAALRRDGAPSPDERHRRAGDRAAFAARLVFLDAEDDALRRRFTETRRPHPMAPDRPAIDGIARERRVMTPVRDAADLVIDTTLLSVHDLRRLLAGHFDPARGERMLVSVVSFSFRRGLPREADLVLDVRFLRNPHYVDRLRPLTGRDPEVRAYVEADPGYAPLTARFHDLVVPLLPRFEAEGKSYLTIAVGCTGGRHRSIVAAEALARRLEAAGRTVDLRHRDTDLPPRAGPPPAAAPTPVEERPR